MTDKQELLDKVKQAYDQLKSRQTLVDAIREANSAGVTYAEIAEKLEMTKVGVASIVWRGKQ